MKNFTSLAYWSVFALFIVFAVHEGWTKSLPIVDPGVFVIQGIDTCRNGSGYCILGYDCEVDKDFLTDDENGHCLGLRNAFTPFSSFACCMYNPDAALVAETTTLEPDSVENTTYLYEEAFNEIDGNSHEQLYEVVNVITDTTGILEVVTRPYDPSLGPSLPLPPEINVTWVEQYLNNQAIQNQHKTLPSTQNLVGNIISIIDHPEFLHEAEHSDAFLGKWSDDAEIVENEDFVHTLDVDSPPKTLITNGEDEYIVDHPHEVGWVDDTIDTLVLKETVPKHTIRTPGSDPATHDSGVFNIVPHEGEDSTTVVPLEATTMLESSDVTTKPKNPNPTTMFESSEPTTVPIEIKSTLMQYEDATAKTRNSDISFLQSESDFQYSGEEYSTGQDKLSPLSSLSSDPTVSLPDEGPPERDSFPSNGLMRTDTEHTTEWGYQIPEKQTSLIRHPLHTTPTPLPTYQTSQSPQHNVNVDSSTDSNYKPTFSTDLASEDEVLNPSGKQDGNAIVGHIPSVVISNTLDPNEDGKLPDITRKNEPINRKVDQSFSAQYSSLSAMALAAAETVNSTNITDFYEFQELVDSYNNLVTEVPLQSVIASQSCGVLGRGIPRGRQLFTNPRILGGQITSTIIWCWMAAFFEKNPQGRDRFLCAGSLVEDDLVVATASCLKELFTKELKEFYVVLGDSNLNVDLNIGVERSEIKEVLIHEKYQKYGGVHLNDIGIARLVRRVYLSETVCLVCLPSGEVMSNSECTTTGYGSSASEGDLASLLEDRVSFIHETEVGILRQAVVPVSSPFQCQFSLENTITPDLASHPSLLCTGTKQERLACVDHFDAGSPMTCEVQGRYFLFGLLSWNVNCQSRRDPSVYTNVAVFHRWIRINYLRMIGKTKRTDRSLGDTFKL